MRRDAGFTLLELLVAGAVLVVLLGALGGVLNSSRRAYEANRSVTEAGARLRNAIEAIRYDVGIAGYCVEPASCDLGGPGLEVAVAEEDGDRVITGITARYEEDRFASGVTSASYRVVDGHLMRRSGGVDRAVAEGIQRLVLLGYRSNENDSPTRVYTPPPLQSLSGLDVRIEYLQGGTVQSEDITFTLRNSL